MSPYHQPGLFPLPLSRFILTQLESQLKNLFQHLHIERTAVGARYCFASRERLEQNTHEARMLSEFESQTLVYQLTSSQSCITVTDDEV